MAKFKICIRREFFVTVEAEGNSREEAIEKAFSGEYSNPTDLNTGKPEAVWTANLP